MKKRTAFLLSLLFFAGIGSHGQTALFSFGYSVEQYCETAPFELVVNDFNQYFSEPAYIPDNALEAPDFTKGILFGCKINSVWSTFGIDYHVHRYVDRAGGIDSIGNEYYRKININHNGLGFSYNLNLIHAEGFRAGPGFSFNMDQFYAKFKTGNGTYDEYFVPVDKILLSATARFMLSFGKEDGFNFDIVPYYMLPFRKVNIVDFKHDLNPENSSVFTNEEMTFYPTNMGIMVTLNFNVN